MSIAFLIQVVLLDYLFVIINRTICCKKLTLCLCFLNHNFQDGTPSCFIRRAPEGGNLNVVPSVTSTPAVSSSCQNGICDGYNLNILKLQFFVVNCCNSSLAERKNLIWDKKIQFECKKV